MDKDIQPDGGWTSLVGDEVSDEDILYLPDRKVVSSYRVTIPRDDARDEGIEVGDEVDAKVVTDGGEQIDLPRTEVIQHHRLTIPSGSRERYGVEIGDYVDLYVVTA